MAANKTSGSADVRAWARENGFTVKDRGRFSKEVTDAFNKAHPRAHYSPSHVETVKVTAVRVSDSGRKTPVTRNVSVPEVRAAALAAGVAVGARGRVPQAIMTDFVAGTLGQPVAAPAGE